MRFFVADSQNLSSPEKIFGISVAGIIEKIIYFFSLDFKFIGYYVWE